MPEPEEESDDEVEPKPAWMDPSDESSNLSVADSENSDMFRVSISTRKPFTTESDRDMEKIRALARILRERPLLPPDPEDPTKDFTDITSGIEYPLYHCAFIGCTHIPKTAEGLYRHIHLAHDSFTRYAVAPIPSVRGPGAGSKGTISERFVR